MGRAVGLGFRERHRRLGILMIIAAGKGQAFRVKTGERIRIGLPEGPQVADLFAFATPGLAEVLSTEHTRSCVERLVPAVGEAFHSSRRRPMLQIVGDTSPGVHDLLLRPATRSDTRSSDIPARTATASGTSLRRSASWVSQCRRYRAP
jgi:uncharacterized protein YcgI (DUF1989 family)